MPFWRYDGAGLVAGGTVRRWTGTDWAPPLGGLFTPLDLSPDFYIRPDSLSSLSNNDPVSLWPDSGPNAHSGTASGATRPVYHANAANGQPGVYFDGSDEMHLTNLGVTLSADDSFTTYITIMPTGSLAAYPIIMTWPDNAGWSWIIEFDPSGHIFWGAGSGSYRLYQAAVPLDEVTTLAIRKDSATTGQMWKNGNEITAYSENAGGLQAVPTMSGTVRLASYYIPGFGVNGHIFEIAHFKTPHTASARQQVEGYNAWRYGAVNRLPVSHPYKTAPP